MDNFLNGINYDDKPRSLLFSKQPHPTLLYLLMAIKHKKYISRAFACGFALSALIDWASFNARVWIRVTRRYKFKRNCEKVWCSWPWAHSFDIQRRLANSSRLFAGDFV